MAPSLAATVKKPNLGNQYAKSHKKAQGSQLSNQNALGHIQSPAARKAKSKALLGKKQPAKGQGTTRSSKTRAAKAAREALS